VTDKWSQSAGSDSAH